MKRGGGITLFSKIPIQQLVASIILILFGVSLFYQSRFSLPVGWDVFYHLRVVELIQKSGNLINFDQLSAGGRVHSYLPGYYSLVQSLTLMTGMRQVDIARLLSPLFGVLSAIAIFRWKKGIPGLCVLAIYCLQAGTIDTFIAAGMPEAPTYFLLIIALSSSPLLLGLSSLAIGIIRPSTLILLGLFELIRGLHQRNKSRLLPAILGILPVLLWYQMVPIPMSVPDWGFGVNHEYLESRINLWSVPLIVLGLGMNVETLWTVLYFLMTQLSYLPRRFIYPLIISGALMAGEGMKRIPGRVLQTFVVAVLIILLVSGSWKFWTEIEPNLKYEDLDSMYWMRENLVSGVLAHRDLSTIWILYYAKRPTILDGYSEGLPDAHERMEDVLGAFGSSELKKTGEVGEKYGIKYVSYNLAEEWTFGANITKYGPWETLSENWYSTVKRII